MERTSLTHLFEIDRPWISLGTEEAAAAKWIDSHFYAKEGVHTCVRRVRGHKMKRTALLFDEFAATFQFFDAFGENWDAFDELMRCVDEWLPADTYVLLVRRADALLSHENDKQLVTLLESMHSIAREYSKPIVSDAHFARGAKPFHTLLLTEDPGAIDRIGRIAREAQVPVRLI